MTKRCSRCEQDKSFEDFHWKIKSENKRQSHCKLCVNENGRIVWRDVKLHGKRTRPPRVEITVLEKRCCTCLIVLPADSFANNKDTRDSLASQCKNCFRFYCATRRKRNLEIIIKTKSVPCMDCGVQYPHYVMDLDHRPGTAKKFNLSKAKHKSLKIVVEEIAKCDVVCSNCHRQRTYSRGEFNSCGLTESERSD